jgi:hypothetical protein
MGVTTEMQPSSIPVRNLKKRNTPQTGESALPSVERANSPERKMSDLRRPNWSTGLPIIMVPIMVPINAIATVKPRENLLSWKTVSY